MHATTLSFSLLAPPAPTPRRAPRPAPARARQRRDTPTVLHHPAACADVEPRSRHSPYRRNRDEPPSRATRGPQSCSRASLPTKGRSSCTSTPSARIKALSISNWSIAPDKATTNYGYALSIRQGCSTCDDRPLKSFGIAPDNYIEKSEIVNRELRAARL